MGKVVLTGSEAKGSRIEESWGNLTWFAGGAIGNSEGLTLGRVVIKKGQANPRHCHPNCEEALYLMEGRLDHTLGNARHTLNPGDTIVIPAGVYHNAFSVGEEDADMIVAYSSAERQFVLEK